MRPAAVGAMRSRPWTELRSSWKLKRPKHPALPPNRQTSDASPGTCRWPRVSHSPTIPTILFHHSHAPLETHLSVMALSDQKDHQDHDGPVLLDERSFPDFRTVFGELLSQSTSVEIAILRIRLAAVDLSGRELEAVRRFRVLVAEANAQTVEEESYALTMDPLKRENLNRVLGMLRTGILEIRSAPLGGWSPDFTVFSAGGNPHTLLLGDHWFHRPFPHRGPAWGASFGAEEAQKARTRFAEVWSGAHDIGPALRRLMERTSGRARPPGRSPRLYHSGSERSLPVDTPKGPG